MIDGSRESARAGYVGNVTRCCVRASLGTVEESDLWELWRFACATVKSCIGLSHLLLGRDMGSRADRALYIHKETPSFSHSVTATLREDFFYNGFC